MKSTTGITWSIRRGAEAVLTRSVWNGRTVVLKERVVKGYRHPVLDTRLRKERLKAEARLFGEARALGVPVPIIYDIDVERNMMVMEYIEGRQGREIINDLKISRGEKENLCFEIGRIAGIMHEGNITHGDFTTSNMVWDGRRLCLIDFSMGTKNADIEKKGVDMHLLKEAFQSAHSSEFDLFTTVCDAYTRTYTGGKGVLGKMEEIERRGRYARDGV